MRAEGQRVCKVCGTLLPETSDACPVCVLRGALIAEDDSRPSSVDLNVPELCFEHYQVLRKEDGTPMELGHGAMGVTYKALDVNLRCAVALKVINAGLIGDQSAGQRFVREARAAASVRHPNVASVFHLGKRGNSYFYAMEFVEGETLENLIKRSGQLEVKLALEIATQAAGGLAAVYKQNLVHRDIKPSNIMVILEEGGGLTAKLIDLGLAKTMSETAPESAISAPGGFAGTPEFASPEQFAGIGVDIRSDLYSLGTTLWTMLAGRPPFQGTPAELIYQHQHGVLPLEQLKSVPKQVTSVLETLLHKDPKRRFQTPAELLKTLSTVTNELEKPAKQKHELRTPLVQRVSSRRTRSGRAKAQERSVAVLPFQSLSANKKDTYFADGVHEEIISNLAKLSQLKVISRTSVMTYGAATNRNLRSIGAELGVARVIEGTVRRSGNRVRITTRLVDTQTHETLWSETYDRNLTDIFAIQSDIAQTVCSKLNVHLSKEERKGIEEKPTENLEAYDLYLQAKELFANPPAVRVVDEHATLLKATELLEEATRKDSNFALAYCLLTRAHDELYRLDNDGRQRVLGDAAVNEALRLRPDLPAVHVQAAFHLYLCYRDYERARVHIAIAERALPNSPAALACTAYIDRRLARWEESTRCLEKASVLDPRNPELSKQLAVNYLCLRRDRDSERTYNKVFVLRPEEKPLLMLEKAFLMFGAKGDLRVCRDALGALPDSMKNDRRIVSLRFSYAVWARDWAMAKEILSDDSNEELYFSEAGALVPRDCLQIWLARVQGDFPGIRADFVAARDQLYRKTEANPAGVTLLSALGLIDATLNRPEEAIEEAKRAVEMVPISKDAWEGPLFAYNLAAVYALTNKPDLAFGQLANLEHAHGGILYGQLKLDPAWDPLRKDPRFDKLLAELAPISTTTGAIDARRRINPETLHRTPFAASRTRARERSAKLGPKNISVARLPVTGSDIFGRDEDIAFLDRAWANTDVNVVTIVAWGGVGKSTLLNHWLRRVAADRYRSAELVFGWSFYRQGTSGDTSSADEFLDAALGWFGDPDPRLGSAWEKGERLAKLIAHNRTLLILDGLEPLQNPPGPQEGRLREPSLQALLRELAAFNKGLCVITTRTPVADIADHERTSAIRLDLDQLSSDAGAKLLRALAVKGDETELRSASDEFSGHCLALTLLGSYLSDAYNGDIRRRSAVSGHLAHDARQGDHARKVMQSYQTWLGEGPELAVLRMLGLFDRPADEKALDALLRSPAIPGLTDSLTDLNLTEWNTVLAKLRRAKLLAVEDPHNPGCLDTHPLVREYFGEQLRSQRTEAWRECNRRLYYYYQTLAPQLPDNFREMEPLFSAVICGCNAGLFHGALHEVYIPRIQRGNACFAANVLGARGPLLSALVHFFEGGRWGSPVKTAIEGQGLTAEDQLFVLMQTATYLAAMRGPGAPEAQICYERAEFLCHSLGRPPLLYALIGQWRYIMMTGKLSAAMGVAERVYSLAQEQHDATLTIFGYNALAATLLFRGDFESAGEYAMRGVQIWRSGASQMGPEDVDTPVVGLLCYKAFSEWHLGKIASCKAKLIEAISLAKELKDTHALTDALGWAACLAAIERDPPAAERFASELIELSMRNGFLRWQAIGTLARGWALSASGNTADGVPCVEQGIRDLRATGAVHPSHLRLKAEALYLAHRTPEALDAINEAEKVGERSEERAWCAELQRLRGVFLVAMGAEETGIEASFCEAIRIAKEQKSLSLTKRAEATYAEYRRQKASGSGGRGFRLPL